MTRGDPDSNSAVNLGQTGREASMGHSVCSSELKSNTRDSPLAAPPPSGAPAALKSCKYSLRARSVQARTKADNEEGRPEGEPKAEKRRPPPLSRYRRKTANMRERDRMRDINMAFDALERAIPQREVTQTKVTKVTVLRLAIEYIKALRETLADEDSSNDERKERTNSPDLSLPQPQTMKTSGVDFHDGGRDAYYSSLSASKPVDEVGGRFNTKDSIVDLANRAYFAPDSHDIIQEPSTASNGSSIRGLRDIPRGSSNPLDTIHDLISNSRRTPDPLDAIQDLTDFHLPGGLDLLLDIGPAEDDLDFSSSDSSPPPFSSQYISTAERHYVSRAHAVSGVSEA